MIALLPAGRPGRGDSTTYYTVPWCPMIARHPVPQLPGAAFKLLRVVLKTCRENGVHPSELRTLGPAHFLMGGLRTGKVTEAFIMQETLRVAVELQMFPERPEAPS